MNDSITVSGDNSGIVKIAIVVLVILVGALLFTRAVDNGVFDEETSTTLVDHAEVGFDPAKSGLVFDPELTADEILERAEARAVSILVEAKIQADLMVEEAKIDSERDLELAKINYEKQIKHMRIAAQKEIDTLMVKHEVMRKQLIEEYETEKMKREIDEKI